MESGADRDRKPYDDGYEWHELNRRILTGISQSSEQGACEDEVLKMEEVLALGSDCFAFQEQTKRTLKRKIKALLRTLCSMIQQEQALKTITLATHWLQISPGNSETCPIKATYSVDIDE